MRDNVGEEEPLFPGARWAHSTSWGMRGAPSAASGQVRVSLQLPLAFPRALVFLCPVKKDTDVAMVLETVETT